MVAWRRGAVVLAAGLLGSCGGSTAASPSVALSAPAASPLGSSAAGSAVTVTETEFKLSVDAIEGTAGSVAFAVRNAGTTPHEFDIYQASQPVDALPVGPDGQVDETKVNVVETSHSISNGDTETITVTLDPGTYYLVCNLPGHYSSGMRLTYTVK